LRSRTQNYSRFLTKYIKFNNTISSYSQQLCLSHGSSRNTANRHVHKIKKNVKKNTPQLMTLLRTIRDMLQKLV